MGKGSDVTTDPTQTRRRRTFLWVAASVVLLAAVIYGVAAVSSPKQSDQESPQQATVPTLDTTTAEETGKRLYDQAVEAQASGETTRAVQLTQEALKASPDNAQAKQLLVTLRAASGVTTGANVATGSNGAAAGSAATTAAAAPTQPRVKNIAVLLPATLAGYTFGTPQSQPKEAVVTAEPARGSADARTVTRVLYYVHDRGSEKAARAWVASVNKRVYAKNHASVTVAGGPGYFGTDGTRLASAAFARGPYAFETVVIVPTGKPASARSITLKVADAFPVKR